MVSLSEIIDRRITMYLSKQGLTRSTFWGSMSEELPVRLWSYLRKLYSCTRWDRRHFGFRLRNGVRQSEIVIFRLLQRYARQHCKECSPSWSASVMKTGQCFDGRSMKWPRINTQLPLWWVCIASSGSPARVKLQHSRCHWGYRISPTSNLANRWPFLQSR